MSTYDDHEKVRSLAPMTGTSWECYVEWTSWRAGPHFLSRVLDDVQKECALQHATFTR